MSNARTIFPMRSLSSAGVKLLDCDHRTPKPSPSGFPYIAIPDIQNGHINLANTRLISKADFDSWTRKTKPQAGDIIMTRRGRVGDTAVVPKGLECAIGQDLVILRSDGKRVLQKFLRWALRGPLYEREVQKYLNVGAVFYSLNCGDIPKFEIPVPSIPEQSAISDVLDVLDSKIELNHQMNKTLEAIGRAVFERWFVDFEFLNEEGKPYKSSGGEMVYNEELGSNIPKGWEVKPIDEVADFLNGLAMQKFPAREGEEFLPVIKIKELREGITESSDRANLDVPKEYVVSDGNILFSWSGSLEVVIWGFGNGALNQHLFKVTSKKYPKWFFYYWLLQFLPEYRAIASGKATTMGHIQRHHLSASKVIVPDDESLGKMDKVLNPIIELRVKLQVESRLLSEIRDCLLPKLMSGKIRVPVPMKNLEVS